MPSPGCSAGRPAGAVAWAALVDRGHVLASLCPMGIKNMIDSIDEDYNGSQWCFSG